MSITTTVQTKDIPAIRKWRGARMPAARGSGYIYIYIYVWFRLIEDSTTKQPGQLITAVVDVV